MSDEDENEYDEWVINKIIKKRWRKEKYVNQIIAQEEFLVNWKGYEDEDNSWYTLPELNDLGCGDAEQHIRLFEDSMATPGKKVKRAKDKQKKQLKNEPEKWSSAKQTQDVMAVSEKKKIVEALKKEHDEYLKLTRVNAEENFKKQLEEAKRVQEALAQRIQERANQDMDEFDDEDDEDWDWEEYKPALEENMPPVPRESSETLEKKRQEMLRVVRRNVKKKHYICNQDPELLREAIVCILGHVDAGKTTLLDTLRQSKVQKGEAGGITQQIGATHIPIDYIQKQTEELRQKFSIELKLPGFLFIDTPGHESFSNMRVRGSSLCDIAVVVVDVLHGLQSQAKESLRLLKRTGSRFVVALNKIDKLHGWKAFPKRSFRHSLEEQSEETKDHYKKQLELVRKELMEQGIIATSYWNCKDLDIQVPIIPICGLDGCGIPDLLMFTMLYTQCVLTKQLTKTNTLECAVFEVHEAQGLGQTIDVLLINGKIKVGDKIVLCGLKGPIHTQVRGIFLAGDMQELKGHSEIQSHVDIAEPVRGVKLWAKDMDAVVGGSYLYVVDVKDDVKAIERVVMSQLEELKSRVNISKSGIHVQASTLGSLEALLEFLNENGVAIGSYGLGKVHVKTVKKLINRSGIAKALLAFDVHIDKAATTFAALHGVSIMSGNVIYQLLDQFKARLKHYLSGQQNQTACVVAIAPAYIIHPFTPLIIGIDVLIGSFGIGTKFYLIDNTYLGEVETIQNISTRAAVNAGYAGFVYIVKLSAPGGHARNVVYGRDFFEDDKLFTKIDRRSYETLLHPYRARQDDNNSYYSKILAKYGSFLGYQPDPPAEAPPST
eukprot:TRINITY_DN331_c2_g1_i1.p1 TRINITY_DN331_c2_g1~~TRINITY_DN331_c2_g1_i1.p1  ORF type:complete len:831 (+),score=213.71 TRINITY_DN331_c2_g1_i1:31-2523(+)